MHAIRYWLARRLNELAWLILPEPERGHFGLIWSAKMSEFTTAVETLESDER
jgi:hypothetical protein